MVSPTVENGSLKTRVEVKGDRYSEHTESRPGVPGDSACANDPFPQQQGSQTTQQAGEQDHSPRLGKQALNILSVSHCKFPLHVLANTELGQEADDDKNSEEKRIDT